MTAAQPTRPGERRPSLRRRIAASLALMVFISGLLSAGILGLHVLVTRALEQARADELAAREALGLALAVREHYLHETHTVIQGDGGQVRQHHDWIDGIEHRIDDLLPRVPVSERRALSDLRDTSREIDELFRDRLLPAALAGDLDTVRAHQRQSEKLLSKATEAADAIIGALDERADRTQREALELSRLAIIVGIGGVLLLSVAAGFIGVRLRRAVLAPLGRLSAAASRFGAGEFDFRVDEASLETQELATLGGTLNHMAVELETREQELLETERVAAIGQLTAGIAHEINNPIGVIRGYLKTMIPTVDGEQYAELLEELQILDEEAAACQRIVEDLLTYAREPRLERQVVEVRSLVEAAVRRFESSGSAVAVAVAVERCELELDPVRVHQVLVNLFHNAAESAPGEPVEVSGRSKGPTYVLEIRDRGPGIPPEKRERVFEPFFSDRRGGSGLGLAVCRGIVEGHGGRIRVAAPDAGSPGARVVVELPRLPGITSA